MARLTFQNRGERATALTYAHERVLVHGGLSPADVVLADDGGAYLAGFGFADALAASRC